MLCTRGRLRFCGTMFGAHLEGLSVPVTRVSRDCWTSSTASLMARAGRGAFTVRSEQPVAYWGTTFFVWAGALNLVLLCQGPDRTPSVLGANSEPASAAPGVKETVGSGSAV